VRDAGGNLSISAASITHDPSYFSGVNYIVLTCVLAFLTNSGMSSSSENSCAFYDIHHSTPKCSLINLYNYYNRLGKNVKPFVKNKI
jgi:hypothetical protein